MSKAENQLKLQTAFSYHQAGNLTRAAELYQDVLKNDPRDIHALHYLGIVEASAGNLENAKSLIARSLSGSDAEYFVSGKLCDDPVPGGRL
ncbi:MAG: tetratricopeptide repeat protein [Pseudolabrys sp.]